jgi:hypothetical protein
MGLYAAAVDWAFVSLGLLWLGSIASVARDARARVSNPAATRAAVGAATLLPLVGAAIWLCVRPAETRAERRERRLLTLVAERELGIGESGVLDDPAPQTALRRTPGVQASIAT